MKKVNFIYQKDAKNDPIAEPLLFLKDLKNRGIVVKCDIRDLSEDEIVLLEKVVSSRELVYKCVGLDQMCEALEIIFDCTILGEHNCSKDYLESFLSAGNGPLSTTKKEIEKIKKEILIHIMC